MAVEILYDEDLEKACFFCNTTDIAFGPLISRSEHNGFTADAMARAFEQWCRNGGTRDLRMLPPGELEVQYMSFLLACEDGKRDHLLDDLCAQWDA